MSQPTVWDRIVRRRTIANDLQRIPTRLRLAWRDLQDARDSAAAARRPASPSEQQAFLRDFYAHYDQLVEVLCDCAQYGPETPLEAKYTDLRTWMQANYPSIRQDIKKFIDDDGTSPAIGADAFEILFLAPTLAEFLRADDGHMIGRMMTTRQALTDYADHLRQLVA